MLGTHRNGKIGLPADKRTEVAQFQKDLSMAEFMRAPLYVPAAHVPGNAPGGAEPSARSAR
ncbi:MAG: hypothetical protein AMXMBFR25_24050 [Lysobacterales bacterium]|nr:hypothetical protein [Xanthomonadales bacterium]